ncbi:MAG: CBS domain-containing protein [Alphaproteobacteria bacterium]|jgi:CBS domain-containing protein|nr:CBS domain-containing protein [Alphaproteobacteria bacterium]
MTVAAILKHKGSFVATTTPDCLLADAVRDLATRRIGALVVLGPAGDVAGILSERDIVYALAAHGPAALARRAGEVMTADVITAGFATTYDEAVRAMTEGRFRHMPVVDHGRLAGLVSIGDVVKARMMEQEAEVDGLRAYVAGGA